MAWIRTIPEDEAEGLLKREYDAAIKRAGRVYNIVKINSLKPQVMRTFMQLYLVLMYGPSGLTRAQREMIAVVVSKLNQCHY
ncbi:peroxidase [candidate division KSB1 bacterium]|nr:peroxidase [candidate division KSB1 bacterium]NIR70944.1 peroxidase [candidate division KSB1 bacterium]NIS23248.1 peroxidase [candidate division KSB1 bacterium]NIT70130.1 peroxidase [candidate division KSB1 bacterium]NIU27864.1 peroxidase [candidate division KSB1 bacterium]